MSRLNHTFDTELATKYSVEEAILIHHFQFWISKNKALKKNQKEGRTWTFQTIKEISSHFPYWSDRQVERLLVKLIKNKVIIKSNFNKTSYDHTNWYAFNEESKFISNCSAKDSCSQVIDSHDTPKSGNRSSEIGAAIPDTKKDIYKKSISKEIPKKEKSEIVHNLSASDDAVSLFKYFEEAYKKMRESKGLKFKKITKTKTQMGALTDLLKYHKIEHIKNVIDAVFLDKFWYQHVDKPTYLKIKFEKLEHLLKNNKKPIKKEKSFSERWRDNE